MTSNIRFMSKDLIDWISELRTLPSKYYTEKRFRKILKFKRTWQFVGLTTNSRRRLHRRPYCRVLNEPMVRVQDGESTHMLSNVYTSRHGLCHNIPMGRLQCPYHGRTFNRDGTMKHMPGFEELLIFQ